jgi:outer membrane receptor protein involved in Fe transport
LSGRGARPQNPGELIQTNGQNTNINFTGQANYTKKLTESFQLIGSVGYDIFDRKTSLTEGQTIGGFVVPGWYNLSNSVQQSKASQSSTNYRINGVFGNVNLGYNNWLFLDLSARNDWSSTLPSASNSFFYSAVGVSAVLSDVLKLQDNKYMDYLKLRGSYGTTGKDAGLYLLQSSFTGNPVLQALANGHDLLFPLNGQAGFTQGNFIGGNPDLKPELTTTTEVGVDASFFNDILAVNYTYYNSDHKDQIITVNLPSTSGYTTTVKNIGQINIKDMRLD